MTLHLQACISCVLCLQLSVWQEGGGEVDRSLAEELLPALLEVATCTPIQPLPRQLAYLVSAQYMARVNPEVDVHIYCHMYCGVMMVCR